MRFGGAAFLLCATLVACTTSADVDVESRVATADGSAPRPTTAPPTTLQEPSTTTDGPAVTTPSPDDPTTGETSTSTVPSGDLAPIQPDPTDPDGLRYELDGFDVMVQLRITDADSPPLGYNGFTEARMLPDGTLAAAGFDAWTSQTQPEGAALWTSADGRRWDRSGLELSEPAGQQTIQSLFLLDGDLQVALADVEPFVDDDGTTNTAFGLGVTWREVADGSWGAVELIGDVAVTGHVVEDGDITLLGAQSPNDDGEFSAVSLRLDSPGDPWTRQPVDLDDNDASQMGSVVMDGVDLGDMTLAVGATTATDAIGSVPAELVDTVASNGFTDVAVWQRPTATDAWERLEIEAFEGVNGGAIAYDIVAVAEQLYMVTRETQAYRQVAALWESDDGGISWTPVSFERAVTGNLFDSSFPTQASLSNVDGLLVLIDEVIGPDGWRSLMTIHDPETGSSATHDLAEWAGLTQVESVLDLGEFGLGFGRIDQGPSSSDLQVIQIRRVDADTDEPAVETTSTVPADGGASGA